MLFPYFPFFTCQIPMHSSRYRSAITFIEKPSHARLGPQHCAATASFVSSSQHWSHRIMSIKLSVSLTRLWAQGPGSSLSISVSSTQNVSAQVYVFTLCLINKWMDRWMDEKEREDLDIFYASRGKIRTNEWKLQGGRFQLDWTALNEGNELPHWRYKEKICTNN